MVNPFQFTLGFKDALSKGMGKVSSLFGGIFGKNVGSATKKVDSLSGSIDKLVGVAETAQKVLKSALVFAGVSFAIGELSDNIRTFDQEFSNLIMITGSTSQSHALQDWFDDVGSKVAINRGELVDLTKVARKFNATVTDLDVGGLAATAKITGNSVAGLTENIASMTQTMKLSYQEAVAKSIELTGTTKNANKIMQAFNSTAFNSENRFKALATVMAGVVPPDMRMASTSLNDMGKMIGNIMSSFGRAFAGDPMKSGPIYEIRMAMGSLLTFLQDNMASIKMVFSAIGKVIGSVIKFIVDLAGKMTKKLGDLFGGLKMNVNDFNKNVVLPFITFIEIIKMKVMGWIDAFTDGLSEGFSGLMSSIAPYIDAIKKQMGPLMEALGLGGDQSGVKGFWKTFGNIIGTVLSTIISLTLRLVSKILPSLIKVINILGPAFTKIFGAIGRVFDKLVKAFGTGTDKAGKSFNLLEFIIDTIAAAISLTIETLAIIISGAVDVIVFVIDSILATFEALGKGWDFISNGMQSQINDLAKVFNIISTTVDKVWDHVKMIFTKMSNFIKEQVGQLTSVFSNLFGEEEQSFALSHVAVMANSNSNAFNENNSSAMTVRGATKSVKQQAPMDKSVTIPVSVQLDGKTIAEAVAKSNQKQNYR